MIDGHHRAALARRGGAGMIDADVTELIARVSLPAGAGELVHEHGGDDPERRPDHEHVVHRSV